MVSLEDKGLLSNELKLYLKKVVKKINTKPEISWQYNMEERRYYTYDEMLAKKDEIRFPDQIFTTLHSPVKRAAIRDFRINQFDQLKKKVDFTKFETYASEPFEEVLIKQQDIEFEDITEEEFTDIEQ